MGNGSSMPTGYTTRTAGHKTQGRQGINRKASEAYHKASESHKKT